MVNKKPLVQTPTLRQLINYNDFETYIQTNTHD